MLTQNEYHKRSPLVPQESQDYVLRSPKSWGTHCTCIPLHVSTLFPGNLGMRLCYAHVSLGTLSNYDDDGSAEQMNLRPFKLYCV